MLKTTVVGMALLLVLTVAQFSIAKDSFLNSDADADVNEQHFSATDWKNYVFSAWAQTTDRIALWAGLLNDHNIIGMSRSQLESLLGLGESDCYFIGKS